MKTIMRSFFTAMLSLVAMFVTGSAWADVTPTAVFADFTGANASAGITVGGIKLKGNGNTIATDGKSITISNSTGITLEPTAAQNNATIIVKYSGLPSAAVTSPTILLAARVYGKTDNVGLYLPANDSNKLSAFYDNVTYGDNGYTQIGSMTKRPTVPTSGYFVISYHNSSGTATFVGTEGDSSVTYNGGKVGGLHWSGNYNFDLVSIGAIRNAGTKLSNNVPATGMKVEGIAVIYGAAYLDQAGVTTLSTYKFSSDDSDVFVEPEGTTDENDIAPSFWYRFNGNLTSSGARGFNTFNPGTTYTSDRAGQEGKALIVANGQTVNEPSPTSPQSSLSGDGTKPTPFTISVIAKIAANGQNKVILSEFSKKGNNDDIILAADPINKKILVCKDATILIEQAIDDITTAFHTYVVTGDGSKVTLYVDGVANSTTSTTYPNTTRTACGIFKDGGGGYQTGFAAATGSAIDDYRVYCKKCLTAEQVAKIGKNMNQKEPEVTPTATISGDDTWKNLTWDPSTPTASDKAELTVSANAKLTIDNDTTFKSLKLIGQRNLTIAGITSANVALLSKISIGEFSGKLTLEIDASAGLTADDTLKNLIKTANTQYTFIFKSTVANKGAAVAFGQTAEAIKCHIVFDGGTHSMTYMRANNQTNPFGQNGTGDNPTILITGGTILNFTAKDISYWSGQSDIGGVIRVNDGATLNLLQNGSDTFFYRQRLWLDPGSLTTFNYTAKDQGAGSESCFRFHGGAVQNKEQIYVPASANDMMDKPAVIKQLGAGALHLASDATRGLAIFVGANSKLRLETPITTGGNNPPLIKYGTGVLETIKSITTSSFTFTEGIFASNSTVNKLSIGQNVALDISNGAPTITDTFTAQSKVLKLVIDKPTHMMEVITLPAGTDMTGWTAIVNGRDAENELIAEGNTLKLKWKIPPTIDVDIDDIAVESTSDWNGGTVKIDVSSLTKGDYEGEIAYRLKFGDKIVIGSEADNIAIFKLDEDFRAGHIYRGIFELGYGDAGDKIEAANVIIYEGKLDYKDKDDLWVNETPTTLRSTGAYEPDNGISVEDGIIKIDTEEEVTFSPTLDPDYVDKCDSEFTMTIFASEAVDDDLSVEEGAQAGVMIISDGVGGVEFRFIDGGNEEWAKGPAAELDIDYEVTISFHYAKDEGDNDSVTYRIKGIVEDDTYKYEHRPNTADKVTEIIFTDGTRFKSLLGTCQIEIADPVAQGIKPGEKQEITADNDDEAQEKAAKIPVMIPEDDAVVDALNTDEKKNAYKALFKVVAVKKNGAYTAEVVFAEPAISAIKDDEEKILSEVVSALTSLIGEEGELENIKGRPGLYYGIAADGELVNMGEAQPDEWKIAGADGDIVGLKVKKTASAKQGFYKVICTPIKPEK